MNETFEIQEMLNNISNSITAKEDFIFDQIDAIIGNISESKNQVLKFLETNVNELKKDYLLKLNDSEQRITEILKDIEEDFGINISNTKLELNKIKEDLFMNMTRTNTEIESIKTNLERDIPEQIQS